MKFLKPSKRNFSKKITLSVVSLLACGLGQAAFCGLSLESSFSNYETALLKEFRTIPRLTIWGMSGSNTSVTGQLLFPINGNNTQAFFGIIEGNSRIFNKGGWIGQSGVGLGYRRVIEEQIYGGYITANYNNSPDHFSYWIINPGLEVMGTNWDVSVNGYFALNNKRNVFSTTGWAADDFGVYDYVRYTGHNGYDRRATRTDIEAAGTGFDVKAGHTIPFLPQVKAYLGGYYFKMPDMDKVNGGLVKVVYEVNRYTALELTSTYDNYRHSRTLAGVRLTLGGHGRQEQADFGISTRLLDPIERGYDVTLVPIATKIGTPVVVGGDILRHDNLQWFDSALPATAQSRNASNENGSGTYEDPYKGITPTAVQVISNYKSTIDPGPLLYFKPGEYSFSAFTNNKFQLNYGWSIWGRGVDPKKPAVGAERPVLRGVLGLETTNGTASGNNYIDSVIFYPSNPAASLDDKGIIQMLNTSNVTLHNVKVGDLNAVNGYQTAVWMKNSSLNLRGAEINAWANAANNSIARISGIFADNSTINFVSDSNNVNVLFEGTRTSGTTSGSSVLTKYSYGINATRASVVNFSGKDAVNTVTATVKDPGNNSATGLEVNSSTVNFSDGNNIINALSYDDSEIPTIMELDACYGISSGGTIDGQFAPSYVNFTGGKNLVHSEVKTSTAAREESYGIYAKYLFPGVSTRSGNSYITLSGGENTIESLANSTNEAYSAGFHVGYIGQGAGNPPPSVVTITGESKNKIVARSMSSNTTNSTIASSLGIVIDAAILKIAGGNTSVSAFSDKQTDNITANATGIFNLHGYVEISGGNTYLGNYKNES